MGPRVLVVNAGSSSIKLRLVENESVIGSIDLGAGGGRSPTAELDRAIEQLGTADAIGHRVVHGGARFAAPVRIDEGVVGALRLLAPLAPLHQEPTLAAMAIVPRIRPDTPAVACFDTAFFADLPAAAATYALPAEWRERFGLRRYGFHGLSHAYVTGHLGALGGSGLGTRLVSCHLGSGASVAAIAEGRAVDTSMGFTPLEGLVMSTRSGSVDPGLIVYLLREGMALAELDEGLERRSGLLGVAGTADMVQVLEAAHTGEATALLALDVYLHRLVATIAAMAASMGGLDVLVFTGGVGEHAPEIRSATAQRLAFLGVAVDAEKNASATSDAELTASSAVVRTFVVSAREELEIARQVEGCLRDAAGG